MKNLGALEVLLDGEEETGILGQLLQGSLRLVVEILVARQLGQKASHLTVAGQRSHAKEDLLGLVVLRDGLQRLHVLQPQSVHATRSTRGSANGIRADGASARRPSRAPRRAPPARSRRQRRSRACSTRFGSRNR